MARDIELLQCATSVDTIPHFAYLLTERSQVKRGWHPVRLVGHKWVELCGAIDWLGDALTDSFE